MYAYRKSIKALSVWPESPIKLHGDIAYDAQGQRLDFDNLVKAAANLKPPSSITTMRDGKYMRVIRKDFT